MPIGNAVSFALAGIVLPAIANVRAPKVHRADLPRRRIRPRYLALSALNVVMLLHDTILQLALPLYVLHQTHIPAIVLPPMFVLNTVLVVLVQRRLSRRTATCGCFAVISVLPPVGGVLTLAAGVVALTIGESLQVAGSWELSHEHAPVAERGAHLAVFSIGVGVQQSVGPAIVSLLAVWGAVAWLPFSAAFIIAGTATRRIAVPWPALDREPEPTSPGGEPASR